jgi:hypothetical protein
MNAPLINKLITGKDNVEKVRDQIAAILSLELQNQKRMAQEAAVPDAEEYGVTVYVENPRPYELTNKPIPLRLINVILPKANLISGARTGNQKERAVFWVDCAATGLEGIPLWNEKNANCRAWAVCRLARGILMADAYLYLGMRGIIGSRSVTLMEAGAPQGAGEAVQFAVVRLTLEVEFVERYVEQDGPLIEGIDFEVSPETGEVTV